MTKNDGLEYLFYALGGDMQEVEYPSNTISKGLLLKFNGEKLAEEGVGFGVPVLKKRLETVFPGTAEQIESATSANGTVAAATIRFDMNMVERLKTAKRAGNIPFINPLKEIIAAIHRKVPFIRSFLTFVSETLRKLFGIRTTFVRQASIGSITVSYTINGETGEIAITGRTDELQGDDSDILYFMNELGARFFDRYSDSDGKVLTGADIGTWTEIHADSATFQDAIHGVSFTMQQHAGAKLFSGREAVPGRLAWAGLAYAVPLSTRIFSYTVRLASGEKSNR